MESKKINERIAQINGSIWDLKEERDRLAIQLEESNEPFKVKPVKFKPLKKIKIRLKIDTKNFGGEQDFCKCGTSGDDSNLFKVKNKKRE